MGQLWALALWGFGWLSKWHSGTGAHFFFFDNAWCLRLVCAHLELTREPTFFTINISGRSRGVESVIFKCLLIQQKNQSPKKKKNYNKNKVFITCEVDDKYQSILLISLVEFLVPVMLLTTDLVSNSTRLLLVRNCSHLTISHRNAKCASSHRSFCNPWRIKKIQKIMLVEYIDEYLDKSCWFFYHIDIDFQST